jgi:HD-like signal output (HDOD) protein
VSKKKILFVDDEANVLEGLKRMLRGMRAEWSVAFASGGIEALILLKREPFDVVVTDMRMPDLDGAELLSTVRQLFPHISRIILTGDCGREALLRLIPVAHRHLTKPCDPTLLKDTLQRVCSLKDLLAQDRLQHLVSRLQTIPSLPAIYHEVIQELGSAEPSLHKIGQLVSRDMGMAARIIQVVNSALFGVRTKVVNPTQAVILLGTEMTKMMIVATNIFSQFSERDLEPFSLHAIWEHSLGMSMLARRIAQAERADDFVVDCATLAGLLQNVGVLMLAGNEPATYKKVLARQAAEGISLAVAERNEFGVSHGELGAHLLALWGFPDPVIEAVAWHHQPAGCPGSTFHALTATHVAAYLASQRREAGQMNDMELDIGYLEKLGIAPRLEDWRALANL